MKPCRECQRQISEDAFQCPGCGCPYPAKEKWDGYGYEYKSPVKLFGLPLIHISFKYRQKNPRSGFGSPVPAVGIIAVGQFAFGVVSVAQFGIGVFSLAQFTLAGLAVAQFATAWTSIAQFAVSLKDFFG